VPGLLGREGFFDRFTVIFEQRLERLTLRFRAQDLS